jgi:phage-related protein
MYGQGGVGVRTETNIYDNADVAAYGAFRQTALPPRRTPASAGLRAQVSRKRELREFPDAVQDYMGYALYVAQQGGKHRDAKTLMGFGSAGVVEIVKDYRGDTFRAVYTLRFAGVVYVLHAFQKKSKTGRETPHRDVELIKQRLREAERIAKGEKL